MKLLVNTNRLIAALIKDSVSRKILINNCFDFFTISMSIKEIDEHLPELVEKVSSSKEIVLEMLEQIVQHTTTINDTLIEQRIVEAKEIMDSIDPNDAPFIATALSYNCDIWSDDKHFQQQQKIKVWTTEHLLKLI